MLIIALNQCVVYVFYDGFHLKMRENAVTMLQIEIDGNALLKTGFKKTGFLPFFRKNRLMPKQNETAASDIGFAAGSFLYLPEIRRTNAIHGS